MAKNKKSLIETFFRLVTWLNLIIVSLVLGSAILNGDFNVSFLPKIFLNIIGILILFFSIIAIVLFLFKNNYL